MGKVITVWGSPGSGKSMFCCILAKALTRDKRKAIIINADMNVPMLPVWLPEQIIQTNTSIGQVLSSVEIDTSLVASHVTVLKNYPFIGMMGYAAGENPLSYPEVKYTMVLQLIHAAAKLVDFVILDCSTSMTNVFTPAAIEAGDVVIRILTPDLKGMGCPSALPAPPALARPRSWPGCCPMCPITGALLPLKKAAANLIWSSGMHRAISSIPWYIC